MENNIKKIIVSPLLYVATMVLTTGGCLTPGNSSNALQSVRNQGKDKKIEKKPDSKVQGIETKRKTTEEEKKNNPDEGYESSHEEEDKEEEKKNNPDGGYGSGYEEGDKEKEENNKEGINYKARAQKIEKEARKLKKDVEKRIEEMETIPMDGDTFRELDDFHSFLSDYKKVDQSLNNLIHKASAYNSVTDSWEALRNQKIEAEKEITKLEQNVRPLKEKEKESKPFTNHGDVSDEESDNGGRRRRRWDSGYEEGEHKNDGDMHKKTPKKEISQEQPFFQGISQNRVANINPVVPPPPLPHLSVPKEISQEQPFFQGISQDRVVNIIPVVPPPPHLSVPKEIPLNLPQNNRKKDKENDSEIKPEPRQQLEKGTPEKENSQAQEKLFQELLEKAESLNKKPGERMKKINELEANIANKKKNKDNASETTLEPREKLKERRDAIKPDSEESDTEEWDP